MNFLHGHSPLFIVILFVAVVLLFEGLYLLWNSYQGPEARKIVRRLRALAAGAEGGTRPAMLKTRLLGHLPALEPVLLSLPRAHDLNRLILQSGLDWSVARLVSLSLAAGLFAYALLQFQGFLPAFKWSFACAAAALPLSYVFWQRAGRLEQIERQLPDALDLIGRALRAGHSFPAGLQLAGEEVTDPIARELAMTHDEVNFGVTLQQALANLGERVPLTDLRYFVIAVLIQRETGGNLTEILGKLSNLIRDRLKLHAKIRTLTAEGSISAWTLGLLPFALAAIMNFGNPEFISVLWTLPAGIQLTQITLAVMAFGAVWLWRLTKVHV